LRKYDEYLSSYLTTYAFCLLGNHFHLLVKLNKTTDIIETAIENKVLDLRLSKFLELGKSKDVVAGLIISNQFRKFFMAYAKAINNQEKRTGSLFEKNFRRLIIDNISYLNHAMQYIHYNPVHHRFNNNFKDYPWSSYSKILKPKPSKLPKHQIIESFNGIENYIVFHGEKHDFSIIQNYIIE